MSKKIVKIVKILKSNGDDVMTTQNHNDHEAYERETSIWSEIGSIILNAAIIAGIVLFINYFLFANVKVDGESMAPTLHDGDRLILNKIAGVDRFDIVVFPAPGDKDSKYIKRIIGVPGDEIEYREDELFLNGKYVEEPYILENPFSEDSLYYSTGNFSLESLLGVQKVPDQMYFVLGDNRMNSRDSRTFGFIHEDDIIGRINFRYWPLSDFGFIDHF